MERVKRIGRYLVGRPRAWCWFRWQQSGALEAYSDADWEGDKGTRPCRLGSLQQVVPLSSAASELYAAVKTASEGLGIQQHHEGHGNIVRIESVLGCLSNNVPGQPQRPGQGKARRYAESVDTGGFQIWPVHHEEVRHEREPSRLDDEAAGRSRRLSSSWASWATIFWGLTWIRWRVDRQGTMVRSCRGDVVDDAGAQELV